MPGLMSGPLLPSCNLHILLLLCCYFLPAFLSEEVSEPKPTTTPISSIVFTNTVGGIKADFESYSQFLTQSQTQLMV